MEKKTTDRAHREEVPDSLLPDSLPVVDLNSDSAASGRVWLIVGFVVLLVAVLAFWAISNKAPTKAKTPPVMPVSVAQVVTQTMPAEIRTIGNVSPIVSVAVKSRIEGHIMHVHFKEGQYVHKGDPLFTIDRRPLQAALDEMNANVLKMRASVKQAQAAVAKDKALLSQSLANRAKDVAQQKMWTKEIDRYSYLAKQGAVSQEQVDQVRASSEAINATISADEAATENCRANIESDEANLANARAQLQAAQAQLENARLNLDYTSINAPIDGRTGSLMAFEGNLVKANDNTLVVINQMQPIYVTFAVPEQTLNLVREYQQKGSLKVLSYPSGGHGDGIPGTLTFSENTVDTATGTIKLKATYENKTGELWPGEFVDVTLRLYEQLNAIVVPQQAVQSGQKGHYVFVLNSDNTVHVQPVTVDRTIGPLSVLSSGLNAGQTVVTDGQLQLTEGARVSVKGAQGAAGTQGTASAQGTPAK